MFLSQVCEAEPACRLQSRCCWMVAGVSEETCRSPADHLWVLMDFWCSCFVQRCNSQEALKAALMKQQKEAHKYFCRSLSSPELKIKTEVALSPSERLKPTYAIKGLVFEACPAAAVCGSIWLHFCLSSSDPHQSDLDLLSDSNMSEHFSNFTISTVLDLGHHGAVRCTTNLSSLQFNSIYLFIKCRIKTSSL